MENLDLAPGRLSLARLGDPTIESPLGLSERDGDFIANYVEDDDTVVLHQNKKLIEEFVRKGNYLPAFVKAGPRKKIFFNPGETRAAVVTCGGLCPGINNVIRSLVMELYYRYGIHTIWGIQYGFRGFNPASELPPKALTPEIVKGIHEMGGSFLGSSRGPEESGVIVDWLEHNGIRILFTIGGDGTLHGTEDIFREVERRKLPIAVVGVPKTIDNDIAYVEKTFGLETAFSVAAESIRSAHTEAIGAPNGIGLVRVMGRYSGFIAANAALAMNEVNFVLVPEVPFDLEGPAGFLAVLKKRILEKRHAVIIAAEGAGQELFNTASTARDESGNRALLNIGLFLHQAISDFFKKEGMEVNVKYIDPSYLVRSVPANASDAIYCMQIAQNAVHGAMAGYTGIVVGRWNGRFTYLPLALANSERKFIQPDDELWRTVLEATGQPYSMKNR